MLLFVMPSSSTVAATAGAANASVEEQQITPIAASKSCCALSWLAQH
jgi:hypothetical protein